MNRIGISIFTKPEAGGAYQYTRALLDALKMINANAEDFDFIVYSPFEMWQDICHDMGFEFVHIPSGLINKCVVYMGHLLGKINLDNSFFYSAHPMWKRYKKDNLNLLIISSPTWYGIPKYAKCIIPIFDVMHHFIDFEEISSKDIIKERDKRYLSICKYSDGILVDSKLGSNQVLSLYSGKCSDLENRCFILPYIVSDYIREDNQGDFIELPEKFIFYPAQFWQHKNHIGLIKACSKLKNEGIHVNLVFTGTNKNAYELINKTIDELDIKEQIFNLGYISNEELVYIYQKARAMMFPSFGGPTNIPPIEAMVFGCPVAVANNFAMGQQVKDAGLEFAPDNIDEICNVMKSLWCDDDLCQQLSQNGKRISKEWTVVEFSNSLLDIINKVKGV